MIKIIINSHIDYKQPRDKLFESLSTTGFDFTNVILTLSGSKDDIPPTIENNIVTIYSKNNNYDYNGFDILYRYYDNTLIKNDFYLYLHDTITFSNTFISTIQLLNILLTDKPKDSILISSNLHSNICVIGYEVIQNYKYNFSKVSLTKKEAVELEIKGKVIKNYETILGIKNFGSIHHVRERVFVESKDIYSTGFPRQCFLYPDFGIFKWILWGNDGDILHNTKIPINYE